MPDARDVVVRGLAASAAATTGGNIPRHAAEPVQATLVPRLAARNWIAFLTAYVMLTLLFTRVCRE